MDLVVDGISMNDREGNITVKGGVSIGVIRTNTREYHREVRVTDSRHSKNSSDNGDMSNEKI